MQTRWNHAHNSSSNRSFYDEASSFNRCPSAATCLERPVFSRRCALSRHFIVFRKNRHGRALLFLVHALLVAQHCIVALLLSFTTFVPVGCGRFFRTQTCCKVMRNRHTIMCRTVSRRSSPRATMYLAFRAVVRGCAAGRRTIDDPNTAHSTRPVYLFHLGSAVGGATRSRTIRYDQPPARRRFQLSLTLLAVVSEPWKTGTFRPSRAHCYKIF